MFFSEPYWMLGNEELPSKFKENYYYLNSIQPKRYSSVKEGIKTWLIHRKPLKDVLLQIKGGNQ